MPITDIVEGFYNSATNKKQDLYETRIQVCKSCKLYIKDKIFGARCNSKLFLDPKTDEVSKTRKSGFIRGCGCVLKAKCRVKQSKCPLRKW